MELPRLMRSSAVRTRVAATLGHTRARVLVALALVSLALTPARLTDVATSTPRDALAVAALLERAGHHVTAEAVHWVDEAPRGLQTLGRVRRAVLHVRSEDQLDLLMAEVVYTPEGRPLRLGAVRDLARTSAADERAVTVDGPRIAWLVGTDGAWSSVHLADLSASEHPAVASWTLRERLQHRVRLVQETGRAFGFALRTFQLEPSAASVRLAWTEEGLALNVDGKRGFIASAGGPIEGLRFLHEVPSEPARPGNVTTWAVDRLRASAWFGNDRMQWLKAAAFAALDFLSVAVGDVTGDDGSGAAERELGGLSAVVPADWGDPESGWPPAPLEPVLTPAVEDEGRWRTLDDDPFVGRHPSLPSPFLTTFVRVDPRRKWAQVFVLLWDPRLVELDMVSGTREPESATGETGTGMVARDASLMRRFVGAFNGGFQASHGQFGMVSGRTVYLPPKPYAATLARLSDGTTALGTWPDRADLPEEVVSLRQNLTPLVQDGQINPYGRSWWGGVPPGWHDSARTIRSGLCQTNDGFVGYLYCSSCTHENLADAMAAARCSYGMHLDMNPGHTGLELYRVAPAADLPPLAQDLDSVWQAEGDVSDMPGWRFRGRRMLKYMGLMNFPRYVGRDERDFVALFLRPVLPGPALPTGPAPEQGEGEWQTSGLPQHGWPAAIARVRTRPLAERPDATVAVVAIDPRQIRPLEPAETAPVVVTTAAPSQAGRWIVWERGAFRATPHAPAGGGFLGGAEAPPSSGTVAVACVDAEGMLLVASVITGATPVADAALLTRLLAHRGCTEWVYFASAPPLAVGGEADLAGRARPLGAGARRWGRRIGGGVRRLFADTPVVPPSVWRPLQDGGKR